MNLKQNINLAEHTSFGTGGAAQRFCTVSSLSDLKELKISQPSPYWVLGKGTNSLVSDKGLEGTTFRLENRSIDITDDTLAAGAGALWDDIVKASIDSDLWGLELMSGIPSSLGGAIAGNIAAYGQAIADTLAWVEVVDINADELTIKRLLPDELNFMYRSSIFSSVDYNNIIILSCAFKLSTSRTHELKYENALRVAKEKGYNINTLIGRRETIMLARKRAGSLLNDENSQRTAGSFFKNPLVSWEQAEAVMEHEERSITKAAVLSQNRIHGGSALRVSAAHVLLAAGFERGQSWGPVRLHPDHVLKLENTGGATSQQIYDVSQEIIAIVKTKLNIDLEAEVKFLGDFS